MVLKRGQGEGSKERCHSPMAFLGKAMGEIIAEVKGGNQKAVERGDRERREAEAVRVRQETEAQETRELAAKERAFVRAYPNEERQFDAIAGLAKNLPFRPNTQAGRILAIGSWWAGLTEDERQNFSE